ncbi:MAG: hypothetical protein HZB53_19730 [Chloroflexi bacterium]|nr:hypothetical protein [Chloroflexota bacterium]
MHVNLMCGQCGKHWIVVRWSPTAMNCPRCGSIRLGNARILVEEQLRADKLSAAQERKRVEQAAKPASTG